MKNEIQTANNKGAVKSIKKSAIKNGGVIFSLIMLVPVIFHFLVFYCGVNLGSIALAFSKKTPKGEVFTLDNFTYFFEEMQKPNSAVYMALFNTLEYYLWSVVKYALVIAVAFFFYKKVYFHQVYKVIFFLPMMVPGMVYISVFKNFLQAGGPLYMILRNCFGIELPALFNSPETAKPVILFYTYWSGFGATLLILVGCMNRIPEEIIDAAKLDGCVGMREFWKITIPLVFETIATYFLLGVTTIFQTTGPFLFFVGETMPEVYTLQYWIFTQALGGATNYPAAIGLIFTLIALPLVIVCRWALNRVETVTY